MNAMPAKVAGVPRIAMVVPTPDGVINDRWCWRPPNCRRDRDLSHRRRAGRGALAYGTETIKRRG
jgi:histidinol dehydrogenase